MERMGERVDKARIKNTLEVMMQQQSAMALGRQKRRPRNEALERLKFWLGMPNSYYESDWQPETQPSTDDEDADDTY